MIETTCLHWKDQYIEQGKRDGKKEERETIARNLVGMNLDEDQIIRATGISREDVQRLMAAARATSPNITAESVGVSPVL